MTIDEAIFHCEKEVEHQQKELSYYQDYFMIEYFDSCKKCISDFKQLAEWLKELKTYKEQTDGDLISRQAVIDTFYKYPNISWTTLDILEKINSIPSVTPKTELNGDLISREVVIEWLKGKDIIKLSSQEETARKELKALSSGKLKPCVENMPRTNGDLIAKIDKLPRIKVGNSNSPTVKYCIDEVLLYDLFEHYKAEKTAEKPIKHFGSIECPNCGRLLMLEEQPTEELDGDLISRKEVLKEGAYFSNRPTHTFLKVVKELPAIPQTDLPDILIKEYLSKCECCDECFAEYFCIKNDLRENREPKDYCIENIKQYLSVRNSIDKAEQTYGWCKGCKEYDTEKHCCHRYSSFIRESLQDSINAVLENIKAEIDDLERFYDNDRFSMNGEPMFKVYEVLEIIDKHISGKEKE